MNSHKLNFADEWTEERNWNYATGTGNYCSSPTLPLHWPSLTYRIDRLYTKSSWCRARFHLRIFPVCFWRKKSCLTLSLGRPVLIISADWYGWAQNLSLSPRRYIKACVKSRCESIPESEHGQWIVISNMTSEFVRHLLDKSPTYASLFLLHSRRTVSFTSGGLRRCHQLNVCQWYGPILPERGQRSLRSKSEILSALDILSERTGNGGRVSWHFLFRCEHADVSLSNVCRLPIRFCGRDLFVGWVWSSPASGELRSVCRVYRRFSTRVELCSGFALGPRTEHLQYARQRPVHYWGKREPFIRLFRSNNLEFLLQVPTEPVPDLNYYCDPDRTYVIRHPHDCQKFILCVAGEKRLNRCADQLLFDPVHLRCDIPENVECQVGDGGGDVAYECDASRGVYRAAHPLDCNQFILCVNGNRQFERCAPGLWFDWIDLQCNVESQAICLAPPS